MPNPVTVLFPAEWQPQSAVQLTWPHEETDWRAMLEETTACFVAIAMAIAKREKLLIVCKNATQVIQQLGNIDIGQIIFREMPTNDTWARDHGAISVFIDGKPSVCDFTFNGWGLKFAANFDNQIVRNLFQSGVFSQHAAYLNSQHVVLEGGSIESDGQGCIMTTSRCLLSANRNDFLSKDEIELLLKQMFGANRILWLNHGYLAGDDTDCHIDMLARFCDAQTIAYVHCDDAEDEHFSELQEMERELQAFRTTVGEPYRLLPLPMADCVVYNAERLPASYANFLIINDAVLVPTYRSPRKDAFALQQLQRAFPDREIIGIDCLPLIRQHGSLHCVSMQYPENFIVENSEDQT
ncbi:MAG: agmatine deiminase family protein [Bacteroidales bacterium]|jgi:agmatine/peptidylarginine deiminase|nr:agmatine deiminase family protein [Bacteroidales bacterium]